MLRLVIFEACQFGGLRLLVYHLYLLYHLCGDVLRGGLHIVAKEFLPVYAHRGDGLAVHRYIALLVHLHAVHLLQQVFHHRVLTHFIGSCVVLDGVPFHGHLCRLALHLHFRQVLHILTQANRFQAHIAPGHRNAHHLLSEADIRHKQFILSVLHIRQVVLTFKVRLCALHHR